MRCCVHARDHADMLLLCPQLVILTVAFTVPLFGTFSRRAYHTFMQVGTYEHLESLAD